MQISQNVIRTGMKQGNRKAFLTLLRLKMMFRHGWIKEKPDVIAATLSISTLTLKRHLSKVESLGFIEKQSNGLYFMKCLDWQKRPLDSYERILRKKGLYRPLLSTVRLTMEMCDKEILAHLAAKPAARYFNKCKYLQSLKEDNEIIHQGGLTKTHHPMKVNKFFNGKPNVSPLNRKMVISDKKMAAWLGITVKDFRRNIKPMWLNTGIVTWTSSLVNLEIPWEEFSMGNIPDGVFFHKNNAYTHTTQYHQFPKP